MSVSAGSVHEAMTHADVAKQAPGFTARMVTKAGQMTQIEILARQRELSTETDLVKL